MLSTIFNVKFQVTGLCIVICLLQGFSIVGFEYTSIRIVKGDEFYLVLALAFEIAAVFAAVAFAIGHASIEEVVRAVKTVGIRRTLLWLVITTSIGLPTIFVAVTTLLGSSKSLFIDYSITPVFALLAGYLFDRRLTLPYYLIFSIITCFLGCILIIYSVKDSGADAKILPQGWSAFESYSLGIACVVVSALCGAMNLLFVRKLSLHMSSIAILLVRLLLVGPVILSFYVIHGYVIRGEIKWYVSTDGVYSAILLGILLFVQLWLLYLLLKQQTLMLIAPYLFLIPFFTFWLSIFPFYLVLLTDIPRYEWIGMILILVALAWTEIAQWRIRRWQA